MRATRTLRALAIAALLAFGLALVAACADDTASEPPPVIPGTPPVVDAPGIYDAPGGRVRAVGVLDRVDLEGGFWAVLGVASTDAAESQVVAVIENPDSLDADLDDLRGRYVEVTGILLDGASVRMAGPEIRARDIRVLEGETAE